MSKSPMTRAWYFFLFLVNAAICALCAYLLTSLEGCQSPITATGTMDDSGILTAAFLALFFGIGALACFWAAVSDPKERE